MSNANVVFSMIVFRYFSMLCRYQEVIDIARTSLRVNGDVDVACETLVRRALKKGTTDNVSVLIICLNQ